MFALRLAMGLGLGYVALVLLAWRFQDRMAFPAPRAAVPDPGALHVANAERVELTARDGTRLLGWFFRPVDPGNASTPPLHRPPTVPGLLWFYGNGENV